MDVKNFPKLKTVGQAMAFFTYAIYKAGLQIIELEAERGRPLYEIFTVKASEWNSECQYASEQLNVPGIDFWVNPDGDKLYAILDTDLVYFQGENFEYMSDAEVSAWVQGAIMAFRIQSTFGEDGATSGN